MPDNTPTQYQQWVSVAAQETGLPPGIVAWQINDESGWNPKAVSPTGAEGLAQFEPGTWQTYGEGSPFSPQDSLNAYVKYMRTLLGQYHGNVRNALAAYNAGPGNIAAGYGYADNILSQAKAGVSLHVGSMPSGNSGVTATTTSFNPFGTIASLLGLSSLGDLFQRFGLVLLGAGLIIAGIVILTSKEAKTVVKTVEENPELLA